MKFYSILGKAGEDKDIGISTEGLTHGLFLFPISADPTSAVNVEYLSKRGW